MSARSVSRSGGPLKENIKNCGSDSWEGTYSGPCWKEKANFGSSSPKH
jgi:hypothetical protein